MNLILAWVVEDSGEQKETAKLREKRFLQDFLISPVGGHS